MTLRVAVIIPALNEAGQIGDCVRSAWDAGADEVWVSDGGSQDNTPALAAKEGASLVMVGPPGRGGQLNRGAARAGGEALLFLHADNRLPAGAADQLRACLETSPEVVGGCFRQRIDATAWIFRVLESGNAWRARWLQRPYGDQALFVRRSAYQQLGGFPDQPLMEDLEFGRRLARLGRLAVLPGPVRVSARRWRRHGVVRQTLRNWSLVLRYACGASPESLAASYRRHDV